LPVWHGFNIKGDELLHRLETLLAGNVALNEAEDSLQIWPLASDILRLFIESNGVKMHLLLHNNSSVVFKLGSNAFLLLIKRVISSNVYFIYGHIATNDARGISFLLSNQY